MSLANLKLSEIAQSGYAVRVMPEDPFSEETVVNAVDLVTGQVWRGAGPSLIDAVEDLERRLRDDAPIEPAGVTPQTPIMDRDSRSIAIVLMLVAVVFAVDLFATGINLGILFLVPLCIAFRRRMAAGWYAPLAVLIMLLIFSTQVLTETFAGPWGQEPAGKLNRCFVVFAIAGSAMIMKMLRASESPQAGTSQHPRWADEYARSKPSLVAYFATRKQLFAWTIAVYITAVFVGDIVTPVTANLPIFYLLPVALVAATLRRSWVWALVALLLTLTVWGYFESPRTGTIPAEVGLVVVNRLVTCGSLALVALLFIFGKHGSGPRRVAH